MLTKLPVPNDVLIRDPAFNQEKALVGAFFVIMNLCVDLRFKLYP